VLAVTEVSTAQSGVVAEPVPSNRQIKFSVGPSFGYNVGHTTYDFAIGVPGAASGEIAYLRSELEFPVDQFMAGGAVRLQSFLGDVEDWSLMLSGLISANNPGGTMTDIDWVRVVDGYGGTFSHTESSSEGSNLIVNFQFTKRLVGRTRHSIGVAAGFRYQRIRQDIDNFAGWQVPYYQPTPTRVEFEVNNVPALEYRVTYVMPMAGLHLVLRPSRAVSVDARALYALTMADDFDDHLLRNKEATADGRGSGFVGSLRADWLLRERAPGSRPFIGVEAEVVTLTVEGDQKQVWYDDEVVQGEVIVPRGTVYSGLPHDFISTQYRVGLRFGFRF
jgi:hypothetical protein